jgi:ankyrin repeat protein
MFFFTGRSALHAAAFAGSVFAAHALIRAGADISATTRDKKTPLVLAVRSMYVLMDGWM